jgi:hypothetical protein
MTLSAKHAVYSCLLAVTCLLVWWYGTTESSDSSDLSVSGEFTEASGPQVEAGNNALTHVAVIESKNKTVTAARPSVPGEKHPTTISPQDQLQELAWLLTNSDAGSQQSAEELVEIIYQRGYESLFAIHDYLVRDMGFGSGETPGPDEQNLRRVLIDLLLRFDGAEVEHFALELLNSHPTPSEIWQLGRYLEQKQPGKYTDSVRLIAEEAFLHSDPATEIPGGFFQLLGETGNGETAYLLSDVPIHQDAYANFALAAIPDGSGIPMLEQEALLQGSGQPSTRSRLIIELLASQAFRNPEAGDVLIEMAERGLIPADTWPHVMAIVSGSLMLTLEPPAQGQLETHTIFRSEGNQVIYRVVRPLVDEPPDIADQRHQLLDSLQALAPG